MRDAGLASAEGVDGRDRVVCEQPFRGWPARPVPWRPPTPRPSRSFRPSRDETCPPLAPLLGVEPASELSGGALGQLLTGVRRDQGVGTDARLTPLQSLPESRRVRMRGQQNVARCSSEEGEALLEVLNRRRVLAAVGEAEAVGRDRRHAVRVDEAQTAFAFARLPSPTCPAGSVAGGEVSGQTYVADA